MLDDDNKRFLISFCCLFHLFVSHFECFWNWKPREDEMNKSCFSNVCSRQVENTNVSSKDCLEQRYFLRGIRPNCIIASWAQVVSRSYGLFPPPAPAPLPSSRHTFLSTESWCGYVKTPWRIIELTFRVLALLLLWRRANARNVSSNVSRYREPRFLASPQTPQSVGNLKIKIKEILDLSCSFCVFIRCVFVGVSYQ